MTASDVLVEILIDWGVEFVFGLPGDGINGVIEALRTHKDKIKFIQVRHEEAAAFMACGYAKVTGKLGVCLATSGPGAIHLLNGLYDAKMDGQPVLAITGMQFSDLIGTHSRAVSECTGTGDSGSSGRFQYCPIAWQDKSRTGVEIRRIDCPWRARRNGHHQGRIQGQSERVDLGKTSHGSHGFNGIF
jgi:hypothetical protein